jgi:predicted small secreted protein
MVSATPAWRGIPLKRVKQMKKLLGVLLPLASAAGMTLVLSACNTVEGVGRDLERAGDAIQDEADDAQERRRRNN